MFTYRIEGQQDDGSWSVQEFRSVDDGDAITIGLRLRTSNKCELFQADRWLATFDGRAVANNISEPPANDNTNGGFVEMETEVAYFHRHALQEREWARISESSAAKLAHLRMAEHLESLARVVEAARRRLTYYDVNASQGTVRAHASL